jgi:hypothetical protein
MASATVKIFNGFTQMQPDFLDVNYRYSTKVNQLKVKSYTAPISPIMMENES